MFTKVEARYALRSALFGVSSAVTLLTASLPDISGGEGMAAGLAFITGALTYAGIGAAFPQVEPNIGNKMGE